MNLAIIPAAGRSSRLGRGKALLPLGKSLVVDIIATKLAQAGVERSIVVAAVGDDSLVAHCRRSRLEVVVNEHPERGMLSSVQAGYRHIEADLEPKDIVVVCPVDFPAVQPRTVRALLDELDQAATVAVVPSFAGKRGHPLALSMEAAAQISHLDAEIGLRQLLMRVPYSAIDVDDEGIHRDLDTWGDYLELLGGAAL